VPEAERGVRIAPVIRAEAVRILPAGRERARRCHERGLPADDPALPIRWLSVERCGCYLSVAVGPIEPGGKDEELMEFQLRVDG
jgi:hypothetical protein